MASWSIKIPIAATPPQPPPSQKVTRLTFTSPSPQTLSPLFSLPGELRNLIWEYALTPYSDTSRPYPTSTCYARPDYLAPRTSAVALLRTCKAIYSEAWYLPWTTAELGFYLTWDVRRPPRVETVETVQKILNHLHDAGVDTSIGHVRVFAQLCNLEDGRQLQTILGMEHFKPKAVTITIRHTDFWSWEADAMLRVAGYWVSYCTFPDTVEVIRVEFESLERKKGQVDEICQEAVEKWVFAGMEGKKYIAAKGVVRNEKGVEVVDGETEVMRWKGGSTWQGLRWIRDERENGKLDYYVKTVVWRIRKPQEIEEQVKSVRKEEEEEEEQELDDTDREETAREIYKRLLNSDSSHQVSLYASDNHPLFSPGEVIITTPEEVEQVLVGKEEDMTVEVLKETISTWRRENPVLARQVSRSIESTYPNYHGDVDWNDNSDYEDSDYGAWWQ